jgi:Domain of unknown function (DUF4126)
VFLPLLIVSAAAYTGHLSLGGNFAWLATPSALTMLSVAAIAEILAYYIPVVDNLLDTLNVLASNSMSTLPPKSCRDCRQSACPLRANSGLMHCNKICEIRQGQICDWRSGELFTPRRRLFGRQNEKTLLFPWLVERG